MRFALPLNLARGLRPQAWCVAGRGFSREDLKAELLGGGDGRGIVADAVISVEAIALKLVPRAKGRMLGALARQEALRTLLAVPAIGARMPELKRLRRQTTFFRRLDQAVQNGRAAFAHADEAEVVAARLEQSFGTSPVRSEVSGLARAYESWLEGMDLWDLPRLLAEATRVLEAGWPEGVSAPKQIHHFTIGEPESLERAFWEALSRQVEVITQGRPAAAGEPAAHVGATLRWERWHTLDDAAESLAERLSGQTSLADDAVLIPDGMETRRSLRRALSRHGVALADPRDPTRLRWDERIKWAMLPFEVVAQDFERTRVLSYLRSYDPGPQYPLWLEEIHARGVRGGLESYMGGGLIGVHARLGELQSKFGGRKLASEIASEHVALVERAVRKTPERAWLASFIQQVWGDLLADQRLLGLGDRRAPTLYWWERFRERVDQAAAPLERERPRDGLRSYRAHQLPIRAARRVYVLGLPSQWLTGEAPGDYWLTARDRELLAAEFGVRSSFQARAERLEALRFWLASAEEVVFLDAEYDELGGERESVEGFLRELEVELGARFPAEPESRGAHESWLPSFSAIRLVSPREVRLPVPIGQFEERPVLSATALEHYSRCGFLALGMSRWKLRDIREPDSELWPEVRGQILHEAARTLVASRTADGVFTVTPGEALAIAWKKVPPRGLLKGRRTEEYVKSRLKRVLEAFIEKEREYVAKSGARVLSLEEEGSFRLALPKSTPDAPEFFVKGVPDRIDDVAGGLFVIDYKTSSAPAPHGTEMIDLGYRLQMPIYALAAAQKTGRPVIGLQFVELNRKAGRSSGIFFKEHNGKEPGKPTQVRASSKSLVPLAPEEAWNALERQILDHGRAYLRGEFQARPKRARKECDRCMMRDLCGDRRVIVDESAVEGQAEASDA